MPRHYRITQALLLFFFSLPFIFMDRSLGDDGATSASLYKKADISTKVFTHDFEKVWKAALQATKKYEIAFVDEESGFIKTRWIDNTFDEQFYQLDWDSFRASKVQLLVLVKRGFLKGKDATLVSLYKKHRIIPTVQESKASKEDTSAFSIPQSPWKATPTDGALEKTVLYRIKRLIFMDKLLRREIEKAEEQEKQAKVMEKELENMRKAEEEKAAIERKKSAGKGRRKGKKGP